MGCSRSTSPIEVPKIPQGYKVILRLRPFGYFEDRPGGLIESLNRRLNCAVAEDFGFA